MNFAVQILAACSLCHARQVAGAGVVAENHISCMEMVCSGMQCMLCSVHVIWPFLVLSFLSLTFSTFFFFALAQAW